MSQNWIDGLYMVLALGFMLMGGVLGYWIGRERGAEQERQRYIRHRRREAQRYGIQGRG